MTYLPIAGSGSTPVSNTTNGGGGGFAGGALFFPATVPLNRIGRWIVIAQFVVNAAGHPNGNNWPGAQILVNDAGVGIVFANFDIANQLSANTVYTFAGIVTANATSDFSRLYMNPAPGTGSFASCTITAYFIPTPDHRQ